MHLELEDLVCLTCCHF